MSGTTTPWLHPGERQQWCDLVRPPTGYRLVAAVGTTYALDPVALTALLIAMVDGEPERTSDYAELLTAITRLANKVRVFVHRGGISTDEKPQGGSHRVLALLDRMVCEMRPAAGKFHPKVWVLHYTAAERPDRGDGADAQLPPDMVRLICGSHNITRTTNWELFAAIDGSVEALPSSRGQVEGLRLFVEALLREAKSMPNELHDLSTIISKTTFALGEHAPAVLRWQSATATRLQDHLGQGPAAFVISPFLTKDFLQQISRRFDKVDVLSRQEALDDTWQPALADKIAAWVFSEGGESPQMGLHAKLIACQRQTGRVDVFLGSANATSPGWGLWQAVNWEAMLQLPGGSSLQPMLAAMGCHDGDPSWVRPYVPTAPQEPDEDNKARKQLDAVTDQLSALTFTACYDESAMTLTVKADDAVQLLTTVAAIAQWSTVIIRPLASIDAAPAPLVEFASAVPFAGVGLDLVSEFIWVRVEHVAQRIKKTFAIKAKLTVASEFWDRRRRAALQAMLTRDQFLRVMEALLVGRFERDPKQTKRSAHRAGAVPNSRHPRVFDFVSAEHVMQACLDDPSRVQAVDELIKSVEGTKWVDKGFQQFWRAFVGARAKEARKRA